MGMFFSYPRILFLTYTSSLFSGFELDGHFYTSPNQKDDPLTLSVSYSCLGTSVHPVFSLSTFLALPWCDDVSFRNPFRADPSCGRQAWIPTSGRCCEVLEDSRTILLSDRFGPSFVIRSRPSHRCLYMIQQRSRTFSPLQFRAALIIFIVPSYLASLVLQPRSHQSATNHRYSCWYRSTRSILQSNIYRVLICYHLNSCFPRLLSLLPPPCSSVFDTMSLLPPRLLFSSTPLSIITTMLVRIWYDGSVTTSFLVFLDSALYDRDITHLSVRKPLHCLSTLNLFIYSRADLLRAEIRWKYIIY